jgi:hypothetical protein
MKRFALLLLTIIGLLAVASQAEVQTVTISNFSKYGSGEACHVDPMFYDSFNAIYKTVKDQDPSHTSKGAAILILNFFNLPTHGECRDLKSNTIKLDTADEPTFVVVILTNGGGGHEATKAYWSIVPIDGSKRSNITVEAP